MWPSIKRWRGWAMGEPGGPGRLRTQAEALHVTCEIAGLTLAGPAVPWCAESVTVEAGLRLPTAARRIDDFTLRIAGRDPIRADALRPSPSDDRHHLFFRFAPPVGNTVAELSWRDRPLGRTEIVHVSKDSYLSTLQLVEPTILARIGSATVGCTAVVASQCPGWSAAGVIASPLGLAPLAELGLSAELHDAAGELLATQAVPLLASQLTARQALIAFDPRIRPRKGGPWTVAWRAGHHEIAVQTVRPVTATTARRSLRAITARFVVRTRSGVVIQRHAPMPEERLPFGPCFLVGVIEPGLAARFDLEVRAVGVDRPAWRVEAIVSDGPAPITPGMLQADEVAGLIGFELRHRGRLLATLPLHPAPEVKLTAEGGFVPPSDFAWSPAAEEELAARLGKLAGL